VSSSGGWTPGEAAAKDPRDHSRRPWWQRAVFYQIYPRSFLDTDGDGIGDLEGIRRRLPYLAGLGVDALWLSPFYPSPMADFGYDVSDYCDVDPIFGTLDDAQLLFAEAHEHGLRVIIDLVPNHSSSEHPWFADARQSRSASHRDWYIWRDPVRPVAPGGDPGPPPNNWMATFTGGPAWTWEPSTSQWYLHQFLPEQPDLNWSNPEVVEAMHDVLRFWLNLGADGFRIDVVHGLGKDPALPDDPPEKAAIPHSALNDDPRTHPILRNMRRFVDAFDRDPVLVGEVFLLSTEKVAAYYGRGDELHLAFNFPPLYAPWEADAWRTRIDRTIEVLDPIDAWPTWVLSNHDNPRHRTRYGTDARARAAVLLLLGLRGTPFLFAGEELGLTDAVVPPERVVDPGGRDGCRAPIPWDATPTHGWASEDPWLPWPPDSADRNAAAEEDDRDSFLWLYRRALAARSDSPGLRDGEFTWLEAAPGVLAWERDGGGDRMVVVVNFTDGPIQAGSLPDDRWELVVASDPGMRGRWNGEVPAWAAVWLRPV
jgi:alpha-glucosidase